MRIRGGLSEVSVRVAGSYEYVVHTATTGEERKEAREGVVDEERIYVYILYIYTCVYIYIHTYMKRPTRGEQWSEQQVRVCIHVRVYIQTHLAGCLGCCTYDIFVRKPGSPYVRYQSTSMHLLFFFSFGSSDPSHHLTLPPSFSTIFHPFYHSTFPPLSFSFSLHPCSLSILLLEAVLPLPHTWMNRKRGRPSLDVH